MNVIVAIKADDFDLVTTIVEFPSWEFSCSIRSDRQNDKIIANQGRVFPNASRVPRVLRWKVSPIWLNKTISISVSLSVLTEVEPFIRGNLHQYTNRASLVLAQHGRTSVIRRSRSIYRIPVGPLDCSSSKKCWKLSNRKSEESGLSIFIVGDGILARYRHRPNETDAITLA